MLWHYYGRDQKGEAVTGELERATAQEVARELLTKGVTPVNIDRSESLKKSFGQTLTHLSQYLSGSGVDDEQMVLFCRQMHTIYKSGLPIVDGLQSIQANTKSSEFRICLADITAQLKQGYNLSSCLAKQTGVFSPMIVTMVKVGEGTGNLAPIFLQLSQYLEKSVELKKSLWSSFRYPVFVVASIVVALFVVNFFVVPAFNDLFNQSEAPLPWPTLLLLFFSNLMTQYWLVLLILLAFFTASFVFWLKTDKGKTQWHRVILSFPYIGGLLYKSILARYARAFALMINVQVPLQQCLFLSQQVMANKWLSKKIKSISQGIDRGESLYQGHRKTLMFSPLVLQMINTGEKTGSLPELMNDIADAYERDVEYELKNMSAKIEPVLILFLSMLVGVLALGIFLPMWDLLIISQ